MHTTRKRLLKKLKRGPGAWGGFMLLASLYVTLKAVPAARAEALGRAIGQLMFYLSGPRKRIALGNLETALIHSGLEERTRIFQNFMTHLGLAMVELGHPTLMSEESLRRRIAIEGIEHLQNAYGQGKGIVVATAHFGNFPLMLVRLSLEGYPVGVIVRDPRHRPVARFLDEWRAQWGVKTLKDKPRWASVKKALWLLRDKGVLIVFTDINVSHGGVFVPFFGKWVPTFTGPATLALRTSAPILPAFIRRVCGFHHRLMIGPPLTLSCNEDKDEHVWRITLTLNRITEAMIRRYPEQWWWIHRRFRKARSQEQVGPPVDEIFPHSS